MKTLLIPTDFSEASRNASQYGIKLAESINARIILLHAYSISIPPQSGKVQEMPIDVAPSLEEIDESNKFKTKTEAGILQNDYNVQIEYLSRLGSPIEVITDFLKEDTIDLIIMGMKESGKLKEYILGSTVTDIIKTVEIPVLVIPGTCNFSIIKKVAFAYDYNPETKTTTLEKIKEFATEFNAQLLIVNIVKEKEPVPLENGIAGIKAENLFMDTEHSYYFPEDEDMIHGLNEFSKNMEADILTMIPHKHNVLQMFSKRSQTRKMVYHSLTPLLIFPDKT